MAFNPKGGLKTFTAADVSKKDITNLAKKATSPETALPFFIKADHKFPDGKEGALFLFGKLNKVKAEIKELKGANELHGVAYITLDEAGKTVLNLLPSKGKLASKETILKNAIKAAFTTTHAGYKIGAVISEKEADKLAEAAEAMEDVADEVETKPAPETTEPKEKAAPAISEQDKAAVQEALKSLKTAYDFLFPNAKKA